MATTLLSNLVNPKVFADSVSIKLGNAIRFAPLAYTQNLEGQAGGIISVPKYVYIGDADVIADGNSATPVALTQTSEDLTVQLVMKAVEITDVALKNAFGDPLTEAENQIVASLSNKIDADLLSKLAAIDGTNGTLLHSSTATSLSVNVIADALEKFGENQDGEKYLIVPPSELTNLRKDTNFIYKAVDGSRVDVAGELFGCGVIVSSRVAAKNAYIIKPEALGLYMKQQVNVETDRNILKKSTVVSASVQYACHLRDVSRAIKITLA